MNCKEVVVATDQRQAFVGGLADGKDRLSPQDLEAPAPRGLGCGCDVLRSTYRPPNESERRKCTGVLRTNDIVYIYMNKKYSGERPEASGTGNGNDDVGTVR